MAWFRAGSNVAKLAIRRTLSQSNSYVTRARVVPAQSRQFHATVFRSKEQSSPVPRPVPLSRLTDSFLDGTSSIYLEELQKAWGQRPIAVRPMHNSVSASELSSPQSNSHNSVVQSTAKGEDRKSLDGPIMLAAGCCLETLSMVMLVMV